MTTNVFISVGKTSTPEQENFVSKIEQYLRDNNINPRALGRNEWSSEQPLKAIGRVMSECSGTVIIAFERIHIHDGMELRGNDSRKELKDVKLTTVWNQVEATMAYLLGHPLLVIFEDELRNEGLLEVGYDWHVQRVKIDASTVNRREFIGVFADWKQRVEEYQVEGGRVPARIKNSVDLTELTIGQILSELKPVQLWSILVAILAGLTSIATVAYQLGARFGVSP